MKKSADSVPAINLLDNSRFYIVVGSVLISAIVFFIVNIIISNSTLRGIRLQQSYALLAVLYWYVVLLFSAAYKVKRLNAPLGWFSFARRAIGVMAAYFALLHTLIAFFAQLEGWKGISLLSNSSKWSLGLGLLALLVLLFMAVFSIDAVVNYTKFKNWKWLSRVSYLAGIATIIHVWILGTHVVYSWIQISAFISLVLLFSFEACRLAQKIIGKKKNIRLIWISGIGIWLILIAGLIFIKIKVTSLNDSHQFHNQVPGTTIHAH